MPNLRKALVINFFSNSGATLLKFIVSVILARILSPDEIGVFSMTVLFVNLAHVFRDFGVSSYLQREADLTPDKIRSAAGVMFAMSWLIGITIFFSSGLIGAWFKEPLIVPVLEVLAVGFLFVPFGSITHALLVREFQAEKEAYVTAIGTIFYCGSCLVLAKLDYGSLSLAYANLISVIVSGLAYMPLRPKNAPWTLSLKHWRSVTNFGLGSLVTSSVVAINNAIPDVLLGKLSGARDVGLLSRSNSTVSIFSYVAGSAVTYGAIPYMAQIFHRGESLVPVLSRATALLTGIGWPALALTVVFGEQIVATLYGPDWLSSVPSILPLAIAAAIGMMFHYIPAALNAIGRPYLSAWPLGVTLVARIVAVVMLFDGSLLGFAWILCLATAVTVPVNFSQQMRYFNFTSGMTLKAVLPSVIVTAGTTAVGIGFDMLVYESVIPALELLAAFPVLALSWYVLLRLTRHALLDEVHKLFFVTRSRLAIMFANS
ncbi:oligosaccharide flippase family protein [Massilia sp. UBA6681]|uniref:oligosaccharide flippase family protein n=1 Tax=Massilia sp. UBA6681 TaxID=1946839 RepID=UPI0025C38403|nr:oligosaccharide flippase family protein [Massilia sp. UBA6681]